MNEYRPGSNKPKVESDKKEKEQPKLEKATSGKVRVRKKSIFKKALSPFIQEDINNVGSYIWTDVIVPKILNMIDEAGSEALHKMLFGINSSTSRRNGASRINYHEANNPKHDRGNRQRTPYADFDDIIFDSRGDAEQVLDAMWDTLTRYDRVRVADYYDLAGYTPPYYTSNNFGWDDLKGSHVIRVNDGYMIRLPRAIPLD